MNEEANLVELIFCIIGINEFKTLHKNADRWEMNWF